MSTFTESEKIANSLLSRKGVFIIHKATRTGATFSLIKVALEKEFRVVIVTPTKRIFSEIEKKLPEICKKTFETALIGPNTEICRKLDPRLKLAFQLKENCQGCEFKGKPFNCPFQKLLIKNFDLYGLTYKKLQALQRSLSSDSRTFINKLVECDVVILDEFTLAVLNNVQTIKLVYKDLNKTVRLSDEIELLIPKDKPWGIILRTFLKCFENKKQSGVYENEAWNSILPVGGTENKVFVEGWVDITETTKKGVDTTKLQSAFLCMFAKKVVVTCENGCVSLTPVTDDAMAYLKGFISQIGYDKSVFVIDSYQPSVNFEGIFGKVEHVVWGKKGDPLKTNWKQLVICDTYHFGVNDFFKDKKLQNRIKVTVKKILEEFPPEQIMLVTTNKKMAQVILYWAGFDWQNQDRLKVTWFRSDWMRGVQAENRRIMIIVGGPYLPKNAYVASSKSFKLEDFANETYTLYLGREKEKALPRLLKLDDIRSEFVNSIGRVKDPTGRERSIVVALGMRIGEVKALLEHNFPYKITRPKVTRPSFRGGIVDEGVIIAKLWMNNIQVEELKYLPILARIIAVTKRKKSVPVSQVIVGSTELVKYVAIKYQRPLKKYGVNIVFKKGGVSFKAS